MSRIGKLPIQIPSGVTVTKSEDNTVLAKGPKGELKFQFHPMVSFEIEGSQILCKRKDESKTARSLHGLSRTLLLNMVEGVSKGFEKKLEIHGVGYRVAVQGTKVVLNLGHSHPIEYPLPTGIKVEIDKEKKNIMTVMGADKQMVGQVAANIRSFRKPEPYKGKGIRYMGEHIVRKAGKAAAKDK
ncbi:50S ribosomal protein L6 [Candidatus Peregrinibacteria bacterium]|nr:50S ribosomal protein L6 [Candidatus Peregrinibacteria bacterium]